MPVYVHTESESIKHPAADSAHWNDQGFLEVFAGEKVVAIHAPGRWDYVEVENSETLEDKRKAMHEAASRFFDTIKDIAVGKATEDLDWNARTK